MPNAITKQSGSKLYGVMFGLMLAALFGIFKPITGIIDFFKEFIDGYIDYFTPKKYTKVENVMRPAWLIWNGRVLPYKYDESKAVEVLYWKPWFKSIRDEEII